MRPWDIQDKLVEALGRERKDVKNLLRAAAIDPEIGKTVLTFLRAKVMKEGNDPDNPPVIGLPHDLSPSDYPLGRAKCGETLGEEVGLSQEDIQAGGGVGIFGISGTGKSTLVKIFLLKFSGKAI